MTSNTKQEDEPNSPLVVNTATLKAILRVCVLSPMDGYPGNPDCLWGLPLLIEGLPGTAKTGIIKQLGRELQVNVLSLFPGRHPPEDFSGALIPDGNGDATNICALHQVRKLINDGVGIIFLDELNNAAPATQGAVMSFIHERDAGDRPLPGRVRPIAAQNPENIATAGHVLTPALANRFVHVTYSGVTPEEVHAYEKGARRKTVEEVSHERAVAEGRAPTILEHEEVKIIDSWPDEYPKTLALFTSFTTKNQRLFNRMPPLSHPASKKAWPSARTWDYAKRAWTTAKILGKDEDLCELLLEACVGKGATREFMIHASGIQIPDPLEVLAGRWRLDMDRLDVVVAAYQAALAYVLQRPDAENQKKTAILLWGATKALLDNNLHDIALDISDTLVGHNLARAANDSGLRDACTPIMAALEASGVGKHLNENR